MSDQEMQYEEVLNVAATLRAASQLIEETKTTIAGLNLQTESRYSYWGDGGKHFGQALLQFLTSMDRLEDRLHETEDALRGAVKSMEQGVESAKSRFR
jgi:uncharacterized protein YukE